MEKHKAATPCAVCDHHHEAAAAASGVNIVKSSRGRKPSNKANAQKKKKKQPQRGMGVAQLERLRLQEMPPPPPSIQNSHLQSHVPFPEPIPSVPALHSAGYYGVPPVVVGDGLLGPLEQSRVLYSGFGGESGQVLMSKNLVGLGTSKELSSMPKNMYMHHHHHQQQQPWGVLPQQHCDICLKVVSFHFFFLFLVFGYLILCYIYVYVVWVLIFSFVMWFIFINNFFFFLMKFQLEKEY